MTDFPKLSLQLSPEIVRQAKEAEKLLPARKKVGASTRIAPKVTIEVLRPRAKSRAEGDSAIFIPFSTDTLSYQVRQNCPNLKAYSAKIVRGNVTKKENYIIQLEDASQFRVNCQSVLFPRDSVTSEILGDIDSIISEEEPRLNRVLMDIYPCAPGLVIPDTKAVFFPKSDDDLKNVASICQVNRVYEATVTSVAYGGQIEIRMSCGPKQKLKTFKVPASAVALTFSYMKYEEAMKAIRSTEANILERVSEYLTTGSVPPASEPPPFPVTFSEESEDFQEEYVEESQDYEDSPEELPYINEEVSDDSTEPVVTTEETLSGNIEVIEASVVTTHADEQTLFLRILELQRDQIASQEREITLLEEISHLQIKYTILEQKWLSIELLVNQGDSGNT